MIPFRRERGLVWVFALYLAVCVALPLACWGLGASAATLYLALAVAGLIALGLLAILSRRHPPDAAELELRKRKAVLDAMASMAQVGAWEVDAETRLSEWSEEVFRIHELEPNGPISSATVLSFYHPDVRPTVEAAVKETMRDGKPFDLMLPLTTARGNPRWVRNLGRAVYEGGRITGMRGAIQDVTASYEMQQRLARLSRASAEGHWEYDFVRRIAWLSASFRQLLGEEAREHLCSREQFLDVLVPEDRQRLETELVERTQAGVPYDIELRVRRRDGSLRWVRSRAAMEFDAAGRPLRIGGSIIDIENERAARLELEALRARHDRALRGTHDGVWDWSLVNDECWMSPQFRVLLGYAADDLETVPNTAAGFLALVHPEDDERIRTATRRHLEEDQKYDVEYRLRCRDGRYRWFRSRGSAEYNAAGIPVAFSGSVQDIDDQKAAEFESAEAKRRLARAIAGSSDAFFEAEPAGGGPSWYSPRLREMLEYGPEDPFPDSMLSLLAPADVEAIRMASRHPRDDGLPYEVVVPAPTRRGNTRWLRLRWRAEQDATDGRRRFAGSIQDITVQREAEAALRAATEAAAAANRAKSEFLANMSHEIRTPLNGVLGMTELLLDGRLEPEQRSSAETIRASGAALLKIVNDILDLSKIDAGKLTLEQLPMQVAESVRRATGLLLPQALKRGLALRTAIDPEVPARVVGDPLRLEQILLNLAGNAMKFTHQGEVAIHVRLAERDGARALLEFAVSDTGIGMDAATLERLFAPFTQADATTTRHYGGTGLGLSIVKRLLEQLGGRIDVDSELGKGTRFRFSWPCEVLDTEAVATPTAADEQSEAPAVCVQGRVLVVEDHPVNQMVARRQLERLGCSVVLAENGAIGVSLARSESFDLILMDVQMPILDGLAATREIRATEPPGKRIPIIAATASAMTDELERCRAAGMDELLTKPLSRPQLQALLLRYLPPAAEKVIDEERVQALLAEDREFAAILTTTFIESTREMLAEIDAATARLDRHALATLAHRLRGAATSAGGAEISLIASRLEKQAASAAPAELGAFGAELHRAYAATVRSLESLGLGRNVA